MPSTTSELMRISLRLAQSQLSNYQKVSPLNPANLTRETDKATKGQQALTQARSK